MTQARQQQARPQRRQRPIPSARQTKIKRTRRPAEQVRVDHEQVLVQVEHDVGNAMARKRVEIRAPIGRRRWARIPARRLRDRNGRRPTLREPDMSRSPVTARLYGKMNAATTAAGDRRRSRWRAIARTRRRSISDHDAERGSQHDAVERPRQHQLPAAIARRRSTTAPTGIRFSLARSKATRTSNTRVAVSGWPISSADVKISQDEDASNSMVTFAVPRPQRRRNQACARRI